MPYTPPSVVQRRAAPGIEIPAPTRGDRRFGLFSVADINDDPDADARWQNGAYWESIPCHPAGSVSGECFDPSGIDGGEGEGDDSSGLPLNPHLSPGLAGGEPFAVYGHYICSAASRPLGDASAFARAHLGAWEEHEVERVIATGDRDNPSSSFVGAQDLTPASGPVRLKHAVGLAEHHLATVYGGAPGVIHTPRILASRSDGVWSRQGQRLETQLGTYVAAGAGYDTANINPVTGAPAADGVAWIVVTGRPVIYRGPVFETPNFDGWVDTANNDVTVFAWRAYMVAWECVTAAVAVDLDYPTGG